MVHEMMPVKHNPNVSNWSLEKGYKEKSMKNEYPRRTYRVGDVTGLIVYLNIMEEDLEYICHDTGLGFKIFLSPSGEAIETSGFEFRMPLLEATRIVITPTITTTSDALNTYEPEQRGCYFNSERRLRFFQTYTQSNCETECFANLTVNACGCVKFSMPSEAIFHMPFNFELFFFHGNDFLIF